jgi:hypothetical protein
MNTTANNKVDKANIASILEDIIKELPEYMIMASEDSYINTYEGVRLFINRKGDYYSFFIGGKRFVFTYYKKDDHRTLDIDDESRLLNDKLELIIIDSLERVLRNIRETLKKEIISFNLIIDRLFTKMLKRRKREESKNIKKVEKKIAKVYI